jgi:hypothetical protein
MPYPILKFYLLGILLQVGCTIIAQNNILIHDSLALHADTLEINVDYPVGTDLRFTLGAYTILAGHDSRNTVSRTREKLLGLREVTDITNTFSFTISDSSSNLASVTIEEKNRVNTFHPNALNEDEGNFFIDEFSAGKSKGLTASISIIGDSSETWTLSIVKSRGNRWKPPIDMFLTNETKTINLYHVTSDADYDYSHPFRRLGNMPAMGIEIIDFKKPLCAILYDSGAANNFDMGLHQSFGCKAWMLNTLDPRTKLILAATMSALMLMNNQYLSVLE